jgi:hypothetical protein
LDVAKDRDSQEIASGDVGRLDAQADVDAALASFVKTAADLGLPLSEDEIADKRRELESVAYGQPMVRDSGDYATFEDALAAAGEEAMILDDFQKLDNKAELLNLPFIITRWWFTEGDMGTFVVLRCITRDNRKLVVTDGSTGICAQLKKITLDTGKTANMVVRNGLRVSEYTADTESGPKRAQTFYLT